MAVAQAKQPPPTAWWDGVAEKYFRSPIANPSAYEATLERVHAYLGAEHDVLEIGCGTGGTAIRLAPSFRSMTATDFSPGMIDIANRRVAEAGGSTARFHVAPADGGPFEPESFDGVFASSLLHLLPDQDAALARVHALLRSGGVFISKTTCLGDRILGGLGYRILIRAMQLVGKAPFVRFQKREALIASIERAGFEIVEVRTFEGSPHVPFIVARKS